MPYLTLNKQKLYYARWPARPSEGDREAPALLLAHGAGGTHLDWPAELRRLPGVTVYALDLPGHGRSEKPGRTSVNDYAADVFAFVQALQLDRVIITGHSMGGAIALQMALDYGHVLAGLVLLGTGARLRVAGAILDNVMADFATAVETITHYYWAAGTAPALIAAGRQALAQNDPALLYQDYLACNAFDLMGQLPAITVPALVISATADLLTPVKYGRYLAEQLANAQFAVIEGAAHMMMLERPAEVGEIVQGFVAEVMGKS
jgi:pimeloyl-ACP methyl ester carboxylesterase